MAKWAWIATVLALVTPGVSRADQQPTLPIDGVVTNPDWERRPTGEEMARFYPQIARPFSIQGDAVIQCTVEASGAVTNCSALAEAPAGLGFGAAAVGLSRLFRMKPQLIDGKPVSGAKVKIPIAFRTMPDPEPAAQPAPSAKALALARCLAEARQDSRSFEALVKPVSEQLKRFVTSAPAPRNALAAEILSEEFDRAAAAKSSAFAERVALSYASRYSEQQLAAYVAFYDSPAGRAWTTGEERERSGLNNRATQEVFTEAGAAFCRRVECTAPAAAQLQAPEAGGPQRSDRSVLPIE